MTQIPVWRDSRDLALWALDAHPEAYRAHQAAARALVRLGDLPDALREDQLKGNAGGWRYELALLRTRAETGR